LKLAAGVDFIGPRFILSGFIIAFSAMCGKIEGKQFFGYLNNRVVI
jgi:hypothetical protein